MRHCGYVKISPPLRSLGLLLVLAIAALALVFQGLGTSNPHAPGPRGRPESGNPNSLLRLSYDRWQVVGKPGLELGAFNQPRGVTGLADGSFVVADRSARVQHFDSSGRAISVFTLKDHALGNPKGLCGLPNGNLLICDTHYGRVLEMTLSGQIVKQWGGPGKEPGQFVHPLSCAVDERAGVAYVVEYGAYNDRIQKFRLDGTLIKTWGAFGSEPGQLARPSGITLDALGNVLVADAVNHRVQKFDPDGRLLLVFGAMGSEPGNLLYPYDIACAPDGKLYVVEFNNHRVSVFTPDGKFLKCLGGPGRDLGHFYEPWSLTVDRLGRLLVSDTKNSRIQMIQVSEPHQEAQLSLVK